MLIIKLRQNIEAYQGVDLTEESKMTLSAWLDRWLEQMASVLRPNTLERYRNSLDHHVKPYLGQKKLTQLTAADLREGRTYTLVFSHDWSGEAAMTLERISDPEDGRVVVVFSCREHLSETTLLRAQTVDVVTETLTGLRVPRQALRVLTETVTDSETNETTEETVTGVYVAVGSESEFKPVNVLWQDDTTYLVEPADPNDSHRLSAGDEVLISTVGLYDGKVIR